MSPSPLKESFTRQHLHGWTFWPVLTCQTQPLGTCLTFLSYPSLRRKVGVFCEARCLEGGSFFLDILFDLL